MEIKKSFTGGKMNKSLDDRLMPEGIYRHAENVKVSVTDDDDSGVVQNYLGNTEELDVNALLVDEGFVSQGDTMVPIGSYTDTRRNDIYWFITARDYDIIAVYHENNDGTSNGKLLLVETRGAQAMMKFNEAYLITGVNVIDDLLFFTDGLNSPKRLLIGKTYRDNNISSDTVNVIVKPPLQSPSIELVSEPNVQENTIDDKFLRFSYRYIYENNEVSAMSPFSKTAFEAQEFKFDFFTGRNEAMRNKANLVNITVDMGGPDVKKVEVLMKDTRDKNAVVVGSIDKGDNQEEIYEFRNNKINRIVDDTQLNRLFDNVPLSAKAQDVIGRRIVYGNYKQFYNIKDRQGNDIDPKMTLSYKSFDTTSDVGVETFKSGRDYEAGIAYLDEFGRMTTVLESEKNTVSIPITEGKKKNELVLKINHTAPNEEEYKDYSPFFATSYRVFLKQSRGTYYSLIPINFIQEGTFLYFQIAKYDIDKVKEGDYIYIKNTFSAQGPISKKYKVLEAEQKEKGFLGNKNGNSEDGGFYLKIKEEDQRNFPSNSFVTFEYFSTGATAKKGFNLTNKSSETIQPVDFYKNYLDQPIFYGTGHSILGYDTVSALYNGNQRDQRIIVEVTSSRTFSWRFWDQSVFVDEDVQMNVDAGQRNIISFTYEPNAITSYDLTFAVIYWDTVDYNVGDKFVLNFRSTKQNLFGQPVDFNTEGWTDGGFAAVQLDQSITPGTVIELQIKENGEPQDVQKFISSRSYVNIEEWFFEDGIYNMFNQYSPVSGGNVGASRVFFRRGTALKKVEKQKRDLVQLQNNGQQTGSQVYMFIKGILGNDDLEREFVEFKIKTLTPESLCILETEGVKTPDDIYYELPTTYPIVGNLHFGNGPKDKNQEINKPAEIVLKDFNAICFGNGLESSVIEDDFNGPELLPSPRASSSIDRYEQIDSINSLTYSGIYNDNTSTNDLNQFNLSQANYKPLEQEYGSIQKIYSRDKDLIVFQEDKVSKVYFGKNVLYDAVGGGNVSSIQEVIGEQLPYSGEFGISKNPESFAKWGNDLFFTDESRGAVLNLTQTGIKQISTYGMRSYFRDLFDSTAGKQKLGAFDPHEFKYVLSWNEKEVADCEFSVTPEEIFVTGEQVVDGPLFVIKSNSDWSIEVIQTGSWLVLSRMEGNGDAIITGSLQSNLSGPGTREATIQITYCGGQIKNIPLIQSNNERKVVDVVTTGDTTNDGGKSVQPSYDSPSGGYQGGQAPLGDGGKYYTYDPLEDFVGLGNVPNTGDTVDIIGDTSYQDANGEPLKPFNPNLGNKMYYLDTDTKYTSDQGDDIISNGTLVTPVLSGGVYKGSFTYNATGRYLYMLVDHTNIINMGISVSNIPTPGYELPESINLNNADDIGRYSVSYSHNSTNIRFTIENSNGGVVADSGVLTSPSSGSFSVSKTIFGGDVIKVYGPNSGELYDLSVGTVFLGSFTISSEGYQTVDEACSSVNNQTKYHNGALSLPSLGDIIYNDLNGSSVFDGDGLFYEVGTDAVLVSSNGVVMSIASCSCGETAVPVVNVTDLEVTQGESVSVIFPSINNPISFEASGNCREFIFFGGSGGAVFSGVNCESGVTKEFSVSSNGSVSRCFFVSSPTLVAGSSDATITDNGGCTEGKLPDGLEFISETGEIIGVPNQVGVFNFTFKASNCFGDSSNYTTTITVKPEKPAIPEFQMDTTNPQTSSANACAIGSPSYSTMYHNGILEYPVIYDMIYSDPEGLNLYNGNNQWFLTENGVAILVDADGIVIDTFLCGINTPTPPSYDSVSLAYGVDALDACSNTTFTTYYYDGTFGVNPGNLYDDSAGTTPAAAGNYKYDTGGGFIQFPWDGTSWGAPVDCPL
jgi:hypothetical protein